MRLRSTAPRTIAALLLALLLALATACGSDDDGGDEEGSGSDDTTEETAESGTDLSGLPTYDTVAALNEDLAAAGVSCALEYEGLVDDEGKEVSLCTIEGEQAQLTIYPDAASVQAIVDAPTAVGAVAYGGNWTVLVDTAPTAQVVADALGGQVSAAG